ncbi:MAG: tetratricopeptide repeat protein [Gemmatimonadota bacterium]
MWVDPAVLFDELIADGRFEEADDLLAQALEEDATNGDLLALRALVRNSLDDSEGAVAMAGRAVTLDRSSAFTHWVYGAQLEKAGRRDEAEQAARRSLELDPNSADALALLAQCAIGRGKFSEAVAIAKHGLELDPGHEPCLGLRAFAARYADGGRGAESAFGSLMDAYPLSGFGRAGLGWSSLDRGEVDQARQHFEQALTLDPTATWAREGLIEATKAKNPVYRSVLRLFLWFGRLDSRRRWSIIIGGIVGYQLLGGVIDAVPIAALVAVPLMLGWVGFVLLSWTWQTLSDFVLMMDVDGRKLVTAERRTAAIWVGGTAFAAVMLAILDLLTGSDRMGWAALTTGFMLIPMSSVFNCERGWPRHAMALYTAGVAACIGVGLFGPSAFVVDAYNASLWGSVLGSWLGTWLATREVT